MTDKNRNSRREALQQFIESFGVPKWLISGGLTSVMALCLGVGIAGILYIYNLTSTISVPLLLAAVVAVVAYPLVKLGDKIKLPRAISSILVIFLLLALGWVTAQITFDGVISQAPYIAQQVTDGVDQLADYAKDAMISFGLDEATADDYMSQLTEGVSGLFAPAANGNGNGYVNGADGGGGATTGVDLSGITSTILQGASAVGGFLSGLAGGILSFFFFLVFLYYFLSDFEKIRDWISDNLFADKRLGKSVINDVTYSLSGYFRATTLTAIIVAVAIGIPLWIIGVPLIVPIIIITVLTAYVPFIGALIASAFTVLIALAAGGWEYALAAIVIMLIANNVLQTFVSNKLMGDYLNLHPLAVLIATLFGTVAMGLVGGALGAPFLAIGIAIHKRVQKFKNGELTDEDLEERVHTNKQLHGLIEPLIKIFKRRAAKAS
ncbi:MAG: AI-2E family transporter [Coriobacteriia bacterium]|nr:AI-2E family transporter [Coriobacteriia bacterium]